MTDTVDRLKAALADRYSIERELGSGGMAKVYLAEDLKHHRKVAVKVLKDEVVAGVGAARFLREIEIAAKLTHPHILPLHDSGEADGILYYVMPYVEGESLRQRLDREAQLPLEVALQIAHEVADALGSAHAHDVVHRDVKPENILLVEGHAVVADFGVARAIDAAAGDSLTGSGLVVGTPHYLSPEQGTGATQVDGRADLYALGCVFYEMLAGEPPFTGPTAQVVIARHISERPPSLHVVRPTVPVELEDVLARALAKVPADRFTTAGQFAQAIRTFETGTYERYRPSLARRTRIVLATLIVLGIVAAAWSTIVVSREQLDPNMVVVYPLVVTSDNPVDDHLGEDVAAFAGYALEGAGPLRWIDGWRILDQDCREDVRRLTREQARNLARAQGAGFFLDGRVVPRGDSADIMLALHDVVGDSVVLYSSARGLKAEPWRQGLRAVVKMLPSLIAPGERVDVGALSDRNPIAVAYFLEGEQAYRRAQFAAALPHYHRAVASDSLLAIAALKGAQAASWNRRLPEAGRMVSVALEHVELLTPRHVSLAHGFAAYLSSKADSALKHFREAIELDPEWPEAWMAFGEVYFHLLPSGSPLDSLAETAFMEVNRLDPGFVPALYHLLEFALRKGELQRAVWLMERFREGNPDSATLVPTELMLRCVRDLPENVDWRNHTHEKPDFVLDAARSMTVGGLRQPSCAEAAWRAVLEHDTTGAGSNSRMARRWGAFIGLQSVLVATGQTDELRDLLDSETVIPAHYVGRLSMLDAVAGADIEGLAAAAADQIREAYLSGPADVNRVTQWHLGAWEAHRGDVEAATAIAETLAASADSTGDRLDNLLAKSMLARVALARADSVESLRLLQSLVPDGQREELVWTPWESFGGERLLLAELRFALGERKEAFRVAASLDAPAPVPYSIYVPASLELRLRAARALGDERTALGLVARLEALGRDDLIDLGR